MKWSFEQQHEHLLSFELFNLSHLVDVLLHAADSVFAVFTVHTVHTCTQSVSVLA